MIHRSKLIILSYSVIDRLCLNDQESGLFIGFLTNAVGCVPHKRWMVQLRCFGSLSVELASIIIRFPESRFFFLKRKRGNKCITWDNFIPTWFVIIKSFTVRYFQIFEREEGTLRRQAWWQKPTQWEEEKRKTEINLDHWWRAWGTELTNAVETFCPQTSCKVC